MDKADYDAEVKRIAEEFRKELHLTSEKNIADELRKKELMRIADEALRKLNQTTPDVKNK